MSELLDQDEQRFLLRLAREAISSYFRTGKRPKLRVENPRLLERRGAFVTLRVNGNLRGCIGYPLPTKPLAEAVVEMALAAATQDFRFAPLTEEELPQTKIEISVLTLPRPVKDPQEIEVGRHGIIISRGSYRGLLLPQVPGEYGWDRETFLRHGCLKAGLDEDAWQKGATIEVFEAQVFSE